MENHLNELRRLAAGAENSRTDTGIPRVAMVQGSIPEHELSAVYEPMINLVLQGSKSMTVGDRVLHYCPANYFVMSIDLPAVGTIWPATTGEPYLAIALTLNPAVIANLLDDLPDETLYRDETTETGFSITAVTEELMDAWVRMLRLMEKPEDIPALAPVYEREILFRVLQGPHGAMLREIATPDTAVARVSQVIGLIRKSFAEPLRVETLADKAMMSVSTLHRHFKAVTAMSPLQYQKRIRLLQARTLMTSGGMSVTSAALDVGYESSTQFSREYSRMFGLSPSRDASRIVAAMRGI